MSESGPGSKKPGPRRFRFYFLASTFIAVAATFSAVKPNSSKRVLYGAEAPKPCMQITAPSRPTYLCQPKVRAGFHGHARAHAVGQHGLLIGLVLLVEQFEGRHGDHARVDALLP